MLKKIIKSSKGHKVCAKNLLHQSEENLEMIDKVFLAKSLMIAVDYINEIGDCAFCKYLHNDICGNNTHDCKYEILCGFMDKARDEITDVLDTKH